MLVIVCTRQKNTIYWLYSPSETVSDRIYAPYKRYFTDCIHPVKTLVVVFTQQTNVTYWLYSPNQNINDRNIPPDKPCLLAVFTQWKG